MDEQPLKPANEFLTAQMNELLVAVNTVVSTELEEIKKQAENLFNVVSQLDQKGRP